MVLGPASVAGFVRLNVVAHALGIASGVLLFLGAMGLTARLKEELRVVFSGSFGDILVSR